MTVRYLTVLAVLCILSTAASPTRADSPASTTRPWIGVHVMMGSSAAAAKLRQSIPALAKMGVNVLIVEVDYNFQFAGNKKMFDAGGISPAEARELGDLCRASGIRIIPEMNCLGHQSSGRHTGALLKNYPEFDETPGKFPDNKGIYCRSWCPLNPDVNRVVFPLIDELIDAFGADGFHVGMDEVKIIATGDNPLTKGADPADVFAQAVNDLHDHLVRDKKVEMFMWGDRLLDAKTMGFGSYESSENGTFPAVDKIPKDIVICDWHYDRRAHYKSIPFLLGKGFRVWPCGWKNLAAAQALIEDAKAQNDPRMLGYLSTTWGEVAADKLADFPPTRWAVRAFDAEPASPTP